MCQRHLEKPKYYRENSLKRNSSCVADVNYLSPPTSKSRSPKFFESPTPTPSRQSRGGDGYKWGLLWITNLDSNWLCTA